MEISSLPGFSELGTDGSSFFYQWQTNPTDEFNMLPLSPAAFQHTLQQHHYHDASVLDADRPAKVIKPGSCVFPQSMYPVSNPNHQMGLSRPKQEAVGSHMDLHSTLPRGNAYVTNPQPTFGNQNCGFGSKRVNGTKTGASRGTSQAQDHIIAERKRREKLSQRFIALSRIVPGLKKMDKASVLGDTIKYLKHLQERVKILEEQAIKKTMESVVFVKKSRMFDENGLSGNGTYVNDEPLPEIEVRFCDKNVLIRIHCEKGKGVTEKTLAEVEKMHLTAINSSVVAFGTFALDVTIIAQMDLEFNMTGKDVVKHLKSALEVFAKGNII